MRNPKAIIGKLVSHALGLFGPVHAVATAAVLLLSLTTTVWAQRPIGIPADNSVDAVFTAFHQALSATANDLLADAQRPPLMPRGRPEAISRPSLEMAPGVSVPKRSAPTAEVEKALERVEALRPVIEPILREEGIPLQMTAVALIESGGRTTALSPKGARGLWQIMPDTARRYGLVVTSTLDERLNLDKSTRAAAHYLRDLYTEFGSWPLALAAYNAGEDAVERAIDRAASHDFNSIARSGMLPLETRNYVPAVLNAIGMMKDTSNSYLTTGESKSAMDAVVYAIDQASELEVYE